MARPQTCASPADLVSPLADVLVEVVVQAAPRPASLEFSYSSALEELVSGVFVTQGCIGPPNVGRGALVPGIAVANGVSVGTDGSVGCGDGG